ncbi:nuclease-related domain-containing protein [Thiobacillus denitrificans]|uniref:Nuclease n=1 Tax=Thiobacillus denitrificans TaxID=36861 RepID=A0A106BM86_THIDE|nr:NERD domain-containing protein [Thiobacillus denitrificans]KVW94738.1 nuclease [Thiobacillus denitrificans]
MHLTSVLKPLFDQLWWLLPLLIAAGIANTPWFKGFFGELLVRLSAKFLLNPNEYRAIHNVTLKTPDGTTQIDHIFVSRFGVFVVETKNYSGWIFGDENQATWTQKLFKTTNKFQNPLRQNFKHIKALESLVSLPSETFHSVIVFVGGSEFKTKMPQNVTRAGGYISYIKSKTSPILSASEVEAVYSAISTGRMAPSLATNREHVKKVQLRLDPDTPRSCPKCGAEMVKRTVKSGDKAGSKFWGCSAFPKCRTIQNVT